MNKQKVIEQIGLLTVKEAAIYLNMKESRIRWEIFNKRIPIVKIGRSVMLYKRSLDKWVNDQIIGGAGGGQ